jgi:hypothetical protein
MHEVLSHSSSKALIALVKPDYYTTTLLPVPLLLPLALVLVL